jgi:integrase
MASLVKPWIVRHLDAEGRRVPSDTPGARVVKERADKWYGTGVPGWPKGKRVPLATHKATALALLNKMVQDAMLGRAGLLDAFGVHRARPLTDLRRDDAKDTEHDAGHLGDYMRALAAKGNGAAYVEQAAGRIRAAVTGCGFNTLGDLSPSAIAEWLAAQRAAGAFGTETSNHYVTALRGFGLWLADNDRAEKNPLAKLRRIKAGGHKRHNRRELTGAERAAVLEAARASGVVSMGLTGEDRFHLYLTAAGTGFRASELASLTPESFALDADPPSVTVDAGYTKNRKAVTQPLPPGVAHALRGYLDGCRAGKPVWPGPWRRRAAMLLRIDLKAAGVPYKVHTSAGPAFADFHSLRHAYIAAVVRSGANVKQAQALARHSDPKLTIGVYAHAGLPELGQAVERLALAEGAAMPRPKRADGQEALEALAALGLMFLAALAGVPGVVALPVALTFGTDGDACGRVGTQGVESDPATILPNPMRETA